MTRGKPVDAAMDTTPCAAVKTQTVVVLQCVRQFGHGGSPAPHSIAQEEESH